jgi:hypothetical protein
MEHQIFLSFLTHYPFPSDINSKEYKKEIMKKQKQIQDQMNKLTQRLQIETGEFTLRSIHYSLEDLKKLWNEYQFILSKIE